MSQSVSGRIKFLFKDNELTDILYIKEDEGVSYTIDKLPKETILTGFIWKPELRPLSKADIIKGIPAKKTPAKGKTTTKPKTTTKNSGNDPSRIKPIIPVKKPVVMQKSTPLKPILPILPLDTTKRKTILN
jgi:hypothetical protein